MVSPDELRIPEGMVVGTSPAIADLLAQLRATVKSDLSILLTGETGTGKELFARLIHASGPHGEGPFVAVNCAAIPSELLEAELFGVAARVATGVDARAGLFVQADGGSLFLDEIGEMPERLQAKLLRALQQREVLPVGGSAPRGIDARVISASNRDLGRQVKEGGFRADLYYRLRGLQLELPPLRARREDLPPLILALASRAALKYGRSIRGISRRALALLFEHDWPGNVRELASELERAVLLCPGGGMLRREHFRLGGPAGPRGGAPAGDLPAPPAERTAGGETRGLRARLEAIEREAVLEALALAKGNRAEAARRLGITRNGLGLKIRRLGIPS
ncbi:MAG TPA: sigma 54-interacting transcriptional regulator [Thermoanaerobaculia bacterium]|nr:sigma 54-interacting transcriptional regulator [Thermoanaerobaculia bacterium]